MKNQEDSYVLNPEEYGFHPSDQYPEISDFFGKNTFVKCIAGGFDTPHYWYYSIQVMEPSVWRSPHYTILHGVFTKGKKITEKEWPKPQFVGLISHKNFAEELLKHLFGTTANSSVSHEGQQRLNMNCLYLSKEK